MNPIDELKAIMIHDKTHGTNPYELTKYKIDDLFCSGVYFLFNDEELVYVGQAKNIMSRISQHLGYKNKIFNSYAFIKCHITQMNEIENYFISKYKLVFNGSDNIAQKEYRCKHNIINYQKRRKQNPLIDEIDF